MLVVTWVVSLLVLFVMHDDLALLAPSPSALRIMLHICGDFAKLHGLRFNAN